MKITLKSLDTRDSIGMMLVTFSITAKRKHKEQEVWDGGDLEIFVPALDSLSETRRLAMDGLRKIAQEILDFPANETPDDDPDFFAVA